MLTLCSPYVQDGLHLIRTSYITGAGGSHFLACDILWGALAVERAWAASGALLTSWSVCKNAVKTLYNLLYSSSKGLSVLFVPDTMTCADLIRTLHVSHQTTAALEGHSL